MTNDKQNNKGNFAQNPDRARDAGRKGGEMSGNTKNPDLANKSSHSTNTDRDRT